MRCDDRREVFIVVSIDRGLSMTLTGTRLRNLRDGVVTRLTWPAASIFWARYRRLSPIELLAQVGAP